MAKVRLSPEAFEDLDRLVEFLGETVSFVFDGLRVLADHPLIGRPAGIDLRELVIFRGRSGYLALYSYKPTSDEVLVMAIRHQREVDL